jgi:hypothetical protein
MPQPKKCVVCDNEFDTPGVRCNKCRRNSVTPARFHRLSLPIAPEPGLMMIPLLYSHLAKKKRGNDEE